VNEKNEVESRPVRLGALHDGLREITDGLKPGERLIVDGLQQIRPGVVVQPKLVDMPVSPQRTSIAALDGSRSLTATQRSFVKVRRSWSSPGHPNLT
jgi:hypothetical protein